MRRFLAMLLTTLPVWVVMACEEGDFSKADAVNDSVIHKTGNLQVYFMDVGQGDGILVVTPMGQTVLIDGGTNQCKKVVGYLNTLGIKDLDYMIASHYHEDHIGCTPEILTGREVKTAAFDRGNTPKTDSFSNTCYQLYVAAVQDKRRTADINTPIELDNGSVWISFVALNGNGIAVSDENDLGVVALLHYGMFDLELGGDLGGDSSGNYKDIETSVAPKVGRIEVHKIHHHGSQYSTNENWLTVVQPKVGIISVGNGNSYGHPTMSCVDRLHDATVDLFWTEKGAGAVPVPELDQVWGTIVIDVAQGGTSFTVTGSGGTKIYDSWPDPAVTKESPNLR